MYKKGFSPQPYKNAGHMFDIKIMLGLLTTESLIICLFAPKRI